MNKNYVARDIYTCTDWHDMSTDREWIKEKGKSTYEIEDPLTLIAEDIYELYKNVIAETYTIAAIRKILEEKKPVTIKPVVEETIQTGENSYTENPAEIQIDFEKDGSPFIMEEYSCFDYTCNVYYHIMEIEEGKVGYVVPEHIINPRKGCDLIERLYHKMFTSLEDATAYQNKMMENYSYDFYSNGGYRIEVIDATEIKENPWYKSNLAFVSLAKKMSLSVEQMKEYRYMSGDYALAKLQDKFYKEGPDERKMAIDEAVFKRIEEYVPSECKKACTDAIAHDSFTREMCDKALLLALINVKSQKTLDDIHEALGSYVCRIRELTEDISKAHRGHGFTVISKTGEIRYYENGFGISGWEKAKVPENEYFGKFHYNFGNELDCFREYDPDAFVDEFPSVSLVDDWENRYQKSISIKEENFAFA